MRKYWHVINIGIQNTLVYRMNFIFRSVFGLIPLFATISLWRAIYAGKEGDVAGYTLAQMTSYYLIVTVVDAKDADLEVYRLAPERLLATLTTLGRVDDVGRSFGILKLTRDGTTIDVGLPRRDSKVAPWKACCCSIPSRIAACR